MTIPSRSYLLKNIIESGVDIDESSYDDLCRYMLDSDGIIQAIDLFAHQKVSFGARSTQSEQAYLLLKVLTFLTLFCETFLLTNTRHIFKIK